MAQFLHELTEKEYKSFFDCGKTWGWLMENFKQPPWCRYQEALKGELGCWSLVEWPWKINIHFCRNCDLMVSERDWKEQKYTDKLNKFWKIYCN